MAYRKVTTITRTDNSQWPFWATELQGTDYDTQSTSFLDWVASRSDVTFSFAFENEQNIGGEDIYTVAKATLSFDDESAYTAWNTARADAGQADDYLSDPVVTNYCTANGITIAYTTESD
jgi:hypothetical protein